jgi:hypothetical protein
MLAGQFDQVLERPDGFNQLKEMLLNKGMSFADVPPEVVDRSPAVGRAVLEAAAGDAGLMNKISGNEKMRKSVAPHAADRVREAPNSGERAARIMQAAELGTVAPEGLSDEDLKLMAQAPLSELSRLFKNMPQTNQARDAFRKIATAAAQYGPSRTAQGILQNEAMSQYVNEEVGRKVGFTSDASVGRIIAGANQLMGEKQKQRQDAAKSADPEVKRKALGLGAEIEELRSAVSELRAATQDAATSEEELMRRKKQYEETKSRDKADPGLERLAKQISVLAAAYESKKMTAAEKAEALKRRG